MIFRPWSRRSCFHSAGRWSREQLGPSMAAGLMRPAKGLLRHVPCDNPWQEQILEKVERISIVQTSILQVLRCFSRQTCSKRFSLSRFNLLLSAVHLFTTSCRCIRLTQVTPVSILPARPRWTAGSSHTTKWQNGQTGGAGLQHSATMFSTYQKEDGIIAARINQTRLHLPGR